MNSTIVRYRPKTDSCKQCGSAYTKHSSRDYYCSDACRRTVKLAKDVRYREKMKAAAWKAIGESRICAMCDMPFMPRNLAQKNCPECITALAAREKPIDEFFKPKPPPAFGVVSCINCNRVPASCKCNR